VVPSRSLHLPGDAENGGDERADPTDVATDFFGALSLQDWERAVALVEPRSLDEFRESQLALFTSWAEQRDERRRMRAERRDHMWTSDGALSAEQLERYGDVRLRAFTGAPTLRELAALSAEIFAARHLAAARLAPSAYRVFGHVLESDDIAHVVYRPIDEALQRERLDVAVLHLRRHDWQWQVLLRQDLADGMFILFDLDEPDESDDRLTDASL
jgi:hypothetical protein